MLRKDHSLLSECYGSVKGGNFAAPNMMGKPVIITMDIGEMTPEEMPEPTEGTSAETDLDRLVAISTQLHTQINSGRSFDDDQMRRISQALTILSPIAGNEASNMFTQGYEDVNI